MKYNLSAIMKRAWEIKKSHNDNIFGMCLQIAWTEEKEKTMENKIYKNVKVKSFCYYNERRYSDPWVALVKEDGSFDFSKKIGSYSEPYKSGNSGYLYVFAPVEGQVYGYGQKDYYKPKNTIIEYAVFSNGEFIECDKLGNME